MVRTLDQRVSTAFSSSHAYKFRKGDSPLRTTCGASRQQPVVSDPPRGHNQVLTGNYLGSQSSQVTATSGNSVTWHTTYNWAGGMSRRDDFEHNSDDELQATSTSRAVRVCPNCYLLYSRWQPHRRRQPRLACRAGKESLLHRLDSHCVAVDVQRGVLRTRRRCFLRPVALQQRQQ